MTGAYTLTDYPINRIRTSSETSHIPKTANMTITTNFAIVITPFQWTLYRGAVFAPESEVF